MVAQAVVLLVGWLVFLVHDDQTHLFQRREHRRTRTEHHPGLAAEHALPLVEPLAVSQTAVQHGQQVAEAAVKMGFELRGQGDLRHEHERGLPLVEAVAHRLQVDLGLAAAGHAMEQEGGKGLRGDGRQQETEHLLLLAGQALGRGAPGRRLAEGVAVNALRLFDEQPAVKQAAQRRQVARIPVAQPGPVHRPIAALPVQLEKEGEHPLFRGAEALAGPFLQARDRVRVRRDRQHRSGQEHRPGPGPGAGGTQYLVHLYQPLVFEPLHQGAGRGVAPQSLHGRRLERAAVRQLAQPGGVYALGRDPLRGQGGAAGLGEHDPPAASGSGRGRQRGVDHLADGMVVVAGNPAVERNEARRKKRGRGQYGGDRADGEWGPIILRRRGRAEHVAGDLATAERHEHDPARGQEFVPVSGLGVGQGPGQRRVDRDLIQGRHTAASVGGIRNGGCPAPFPGTRGRACPGHYGAGRNRRWPSGSRACRRRRSACRQIRRRTCPACWTGRAGRR